MEAFDGFHDRVQYDIVGHSGESHCIPFVDHKNPPKDAKMRLETIKVCLQMCKFTYNFIKTPHRPAINPIASI